MGTFATIGLAILKGVGAVWNCKPLRYAALALIAAGAIWIGADYIKHKAAKHARAEAIAEMKAATDAESERRKKVIEDNFALANETAQKLIAEEGKNAELLRRLDALAAQNDRPCLSDDVVNQLRSIGKDRSPASGRAEVPPG